MPIECTSKPLQRELADSIIRYSSVDDLRILLACGASPDDPVTQGLRPLHYAVWQRYVEAVHFLLVRGCDVNARDDCGYTALHLSAEHGYLDIMNLLFEYQAKMDTSEKDCDHALCDEPLRLAIKNGHYEAARTLLEHGANPNTRYFLGSEINLVSPLDTQFLELLLTFGAYVDSKDRNGMTPLMKACRVAQAMDSVILLISHGADVNAQADERHDYRSCLHYAVLSGNHEIVSLLLKQGAKLQIPVDNPAYTMSTPLDLAVLKGDCVLVKKLIDAGADVNKASNILGSPLHVACADNIANRYSIIKILLQSGADPNIVVRSQGGLLLPSILGEYISSNTYLSEEVIELFLRYGARVVLKTQHRDPLGILAHIPVLSKNRKAFFQSNGRSEVL